MSPNTKANSPYKYSTKTITKIVINTNNKKSVVSDNNSTVAVINDEKKSSGITVISLEELKLLSTPNPIIHKNKKTIIKKFNNSWRYLGRN